MSARRSRSAYDVYAVPEPTFDDAEMERMEELRMGMVRPSSPGGPSRSRPRTRQIPMTPHGNFNTDVHKSLPTMEGCMDEHPYEGRMDPVNRQYYYRQWKQKPPTPREPIYRSGRLGSPWRHIKSCINSAGNHLVFIDGTVKTEENYFYPPEVMMEPPNFSMYVSPRMPPRSQSQGSPRRARYSTIFNDRAKEGFKYWVHQPKPIDLHRHFHRLRSNWRQDTA